MEALVLDDATTAALVADRQRLGLDRYDEVHGGRYVINAAPNFEHARLVMATGTCLHRLITADEFVGDTVNVGTSEDFRVTDVCVATGVGDGVWATNGQCRVAVEVLSPNERSGTKPNHYRAHGVAVCIEIDPIDRTVAAQDLGSWHHSAVEVADVLGSELDLAIR